jgi:hypothetical protein
MDIFGVLFSEESLVGILITQIKALPSYYIARLSYSWWLLDIVLDVVCLVTVYYLTRKVVSKYKQGLMRVILPATSSLILQFMVLIFYMYYKVLKYYLF